MPDVEKEMQHGEVVMECLERFYNVSLTNSSDVAKFHVEKPLTEIFESATKETTRPFPTEEDKSKAEELKAQGNNLMKEGRCEDAIDCYDRAFRLDWTNAVYLCNRAAACSKMGKHEEAVKNCKESLELDPKYGKAYGRMGTAYMALEKYQEAKNSFAKAQELDPDNDIYTTNLKTAEEKLREGQEKSSQWTGGGATNLVNSLFSNPAIMNMASQFMANPQMQQMMTSMMSGFGGMTGDSQPVGEQPAAGQPATGQHESQGTATPESNTGSEGANAEAESGAGGFSNIFQFASQMAQQLEQNNPGLVTTLRQTMQNVTGNTDQNPNTDQEGKQNDSSNE